jgi:hypothetical protein
MLGDVLTDDAEWQYRKPRTPARDVIDACVSDFPMVSQIFESYIIPILIKSVPDLQCRQRHSIPNKVLRFFNRHPRAHILFNEVVALFVAK